jgi:hypothetical protein
MRAAIGRLTLWALGAALVTTPALADYTSAAPQQTPPVATGAAKPAPTVSAKVGIALTAARALAEKKKFKEALAKVAEAEAVPNKTPIDILTISMFKVYLYLLLQDFTSAGDAMQAGIETGLLSPEELKQDKHDVAVLYYKGRAGAKLNAAVRAYIAQYGNDTGLLLLMADQAFSDKDYATAAEAAEKALRQAEAEGQKPDEDGLKVWVISLHNLKNSAGYSAAVDTLVKYYPKPEYFHDALIDVGHRPGFADKFKLDLFVLKLTVGTLNTTEEFVEMAQTALTQNLPAYAQKALEAGFAAKTLADNATTRGLLATATRRAAAEKLTPADEADAKHQPTGESLTRLATVAESYGNHAQAIDLYKGGLAKGGLSDIESVRLRLGVAQIQGGKVDAGKATLALVKANNGAADLAKYWVFTTNKP